MKNLKSAVLYPSRLKLLLLKGDFRPLWKEVLWKTPNKVILILFFGLLAGCVFQPGHLLYVGEKDSCGFAVSHHSGQGLRWDEDKFPISFYVHRSVPPKAKDNFISAVSHWNLAWAEYLRDEGLKSFPIFNIVDKNNLYNGKPGTDEHNFLFFAGDDFKRYESNPNTQAITAVASTGHRIKDADILVNDKSFDYYYDSFYNKEITLALKQTERQRALAGSVSPGFWFKTADWLKQLWGLLLKPFKKQEAFRHIATPFPKVPRNKVDFPSLMIHELGHVPGLAHVTADDINDTHHRSRKGSSRTGSYLSVMEPQLSSGRARREITEHDLRNLFCGYLNY